MCQVPRTLPQLRTQSRQKYAYNLNENKTIASRNYYIYVLGTQSEKREVKATREDLNVLFKQFSMLSERIIGDWDNCNLSLKREKSGNTFK